MIPIEFINAISIITDYLLHSMMDEPGLEDPSPLYVIERVNWKQIVPDCEYFGVRVKTYGSDRPRRLSLIQQLISPIIYDIDSAFLSSWQNYVVPDTQAVDIVFMNTLNLVGIAFHSIVPYCYLFILPSAYPYFIIFEGQVLNAIVTLKYSQRLNGIGAHYWSQLSLRRPSAIQIE